MNIVLLTSLFIGEIVAIFFLSRLTLQFAYPTLKKIFKSNRLVVFVVSLVYLPGTIMHELSHYIVALLLNMHPSDMRIFPTIEKDRVKLGHVLYEKHPHDFIRGIIVGIAPFFGGLASLWLIIQMNWHPFFSTYLILAISANMFSSKQDLVDVVYVIPIVLMLWLIWYLLLPFHIVIPILSNALPTLITFLYALQTPLLLSVGIHALLVVILKMV